MCRQGRHKEQGKKLEDKRIVVAARNDEEGKLQEAGPKRDPVSSQTPKAAEDDLTLQTNKQTNKVHLMI